MQTIKATFSSGKTISRNTTRPLDYAYYAVTRYQDFSGFAATEELARKAAAYKSPSFIEIVKTEKE